MEWISLSQFVTYGFSHGTDLYWLNYSNENVNDLSIVKCWRKGAGHVG